ncbi:hypothetical protein [Actinacidiphila glaucinigra]|uniref:hypothetical protein n=1 Tax=Actinacidiphila glaucinigra TaxID=235986 RepID=UPI0036E25BD5
MGGATRRRISGRWMLKRGDLTTRRLLHSEYGGAPQPGISPSNRDPQIFLFYQSSGIDGDGWSRDGFFYYTGSRSDAGNREIVNAWSSGRRLQVMELLPMNARSNSRIHRYVDAFILDGIEVSELADGRGRKVELPRFRLRTIDAATHAPGQIRAPGLSPCVEVKRVERCDLLQRDPQLAIPDDERPETRLSKKFERYLLTQGCPVHRLAIRHTADCAPMWTDVWVGNINLLIEAKAGKNLRDDARMAVGQLADYTRFVPGTLRAVLLPTRPEGDLLRYLRSQGADAIWPDEGDWLTTAAWHSVIGIARVSAL